MTISAKIIADSVSPAGARITTMEIYYPRFIHAEFMTHRVFSRNAASSRAIPIMKMLKTIISDMAMPYHWGANQPGMQAKMELTGWRKWLAKTLWRTAGYVAVGFAYLMFKAGAHKQIVNRITEPWSHIRVCVTSTEWQNFFALRNHEDAQPEIKRLAMHMLYTFHRSIPRKLREGDWHLPYVEPKDWADTLQAAQIAGFRGNEAYDESLRQLILISTARCASTSYKTVDGKEMTWDRAVGLGEKLLGSTPLHASPAEHQAFPDTKSHYERLLIIGDKEELISSGEDWDHPEEHGNFVGFRQHRKQLPYENLEHQPVRVAA